MSHRLLEANGSVRAVSDSELASVESLDPTDPDAAMISLMQATPDTTFLIKLPSSADGRGLSVVGHLAASSQSPVPSVWLSGDLIPDQLSLAFQCGASAVLLSEAMWNQRGEQAWTAALKPPVKLAYRPEVWSEVADISSLRAPKPET